MMMMMMMMIEIKIMMKVMNMRCMENSNQFIVSLFSIDISGTWTTTDFVVSLFFYLTS